MKKITLVLLAAAGILFFPAFANALTVGPVKLEYSVDPGDVVRGEMIVQNEGAESKTFYPSFEKFTEVDGEKQFTKEGSDLSTWFSIQSNILLQPAEQKTIPFTISIPQNADPGGHYAVIWWSTASPNEGQGQVSIVTRAGVLVYVRVSGNITESGKVVEFNINDSQNFFNITPLVLSLAFENDGNVHLKPVGEFTLRNIFGSNRATLAINQYGLQILPQTSKLLNTEWDPDFKPFGFYKASYDVSFGELDRRASGSRWVFIFSWIPFLWTIFGILVVILFPFGIKRYNKWIIEKSAR